MKCRPPLGTAEKRLIRQRCAFGCVICGCPVYEYHHVEGVANSNEVADITLLCDLHHKQVHLDLLPKQIVRDADRNPFCKIHGKTSPYGLHFTGSARSITFATDTIMAPNASALHGLVVDGRSLLGLRAEGDRAFLDMELYNPANELVLRIAENELEYCVGGDWDVTFEGNRLSIKSSPKRNDYRAVIGFHPERGVELEKAALFYNGVSLLADGRWVRGIGFEGTGNKYFLGGSGPVGFLQAGEPTMPGQWIALASKPARLPLTEEVLSEARSRRLDPDRDR